MELHVPRSFALVLLSFHPNFLLSRRLRVKFSRAGAGDGEGPSVDSPAQNLMLSELRNTGHVLQQVGQTMQAIQRNTIDETEEKEGTMGYLRSVNRFLVPAVRGWNTFNVTAGEGVIGRRLFDELQTAGDLGRVNVRKAGFPCPMTNRIAYGAAAFTWGKRPKENLTKVSHRLLAQDFYEATREEFESAPVLFGTALESRRDYVLKRKSSTFACCMDRSTNHLELKLWIS